MRNLLVFAAVIALAIYVVTKLPKKQGSIQALDLNPLSPYSGQGQFFQAVTEGNDGVLLNELAGEAAQQNNVPDLKFNGFSQPQ